MKIYIYFYNHYLTFACSVKVVVPSTLWEDDDDATCA